MTNLIEMLLLLCIPAALTYTYGRMARDQRQGWCSLPRLRLFSLSESGLPTGPLAKVCLTPSNVVTST